MVLKGRTPLWQADNGSPPQSHSRGDANRVSLREVGVKIAGRSSRLNINYRIAAEILGWSLGLLRGEPIDDMEDGLDSIAGCKSQVHGPTPEAGKLRQR